MVKKTNRQRLYTDYYDRIKSLNVKHYGGETSYYSTADLRPAERTLLASLPKGATILDVGCGSGRFSVGAAKLGFKVTGIDITPTAIEAAREKAKREKVKNVSFNETDITEAALLKQYDYVFCPRFVINAISTNTHRRQAIENMYSACKPGGMIFIESFNILYMGKGPLKPLMNVTKSITRRIRIAWAHLTNSSYQGLLPGDIVYPANKAIGASEGYAHLPSIFEVQSYLRSRKTKSIYEVTGVKKFDWLRPFRYSIWIMDDVT